MTLSNVTVLDDGSEREGFDGIPKEEPHLHERWELAMPSGAPVLVQTRQGRTWVPTDGACLVAPGSVHRVAAAGEDGARLERLYVRPATARAVLPERWRQAAEKAPAVVRGAFARDWSTAVVDQAFPSKEAPRMSAARPGHGGLARAVAHLEANLHRTVSLDELSRACGLSKFHLCRMFHRIVGVTPRTYHRHIRLERGRALLHAGRPASVIARELSFSDQSHFIRSFRKQFGVTPGDLVQARTSAPRRPVAAACA